MPPRPRRGFLRRRGDADIRRREMGLARSLRSVEQALTGPSNLPLNIDASNLKEAAEAYIENGEDAETLAASVISAYRRRGADTNHAVTMWYPLVNVVDRPPRWFEMPWVRRRSRLRAQSRRRRLVEGAISHLSGEGVLASLSVGVVARRTPLTMIAGSQGPSISPQGQQSVGLGSGAEASASSVSGDGGQEGDSMTSRFTRHQMERAASQAPAPPPGAIGSTGSAAIPPGQGFEILDETNSSYYVRTSDNREGYVSKSVLEMIPILPGDEVDAV